ncbi:MAG: hypothetical protein JNL38_39125 [Myxococcales bacterium]|nr:hypothetical protein [Myxococcales bacterium]
MSAEGSSPSPAAGEFKGLVVVNAKAFAERARAGGWDEVVGRLGPADRETLAGVISAGWYPIGLYDRVHVALADALGGDEAMRALGRFSAEGDLTTVHRLFLRMASPTVLIQKYAEFWRRYQTSGEWTIGGTPPWRVRAKLDGWGSREEVTRVRLVAYIERMLEIIGFGKGSVVRTPSRASLELIIDVRGD